MTFFRDIWVILLKDFSLETSGNGVFIPAAAFATVIAAVFHFANPSDFATASAAPAAFWISVLFTATVAFERLFETEKKSEALRMTLMSPADRGAVFIGKMLANLLLLLAVEAVFIPLFAVFFRVSVTPVIIPFVSVTLAATVGIAAVGTALSALSAQAKMKGIILPILLFPLLVPVLLSASQAFSALLGGGAEREFARHLRILISFDLAFTTMGTLVYGYIVDED